MGGQRRAGQLARQLLTKGLLYETETMRELKRLLHEKWSLPRLPEEIERLVRRFINCRRGLHGQTNQPKPRISSATSAVVALPTQVANPWYDFINEIIESPLQRGEKSSATSGLARS